ncbi:hypothetical protein QBC40DRAFT_345051 [Triangularia verruculosa]|uniref:Uncharacterized protein n=1 Tax=Triangularia verruculosa TaxID=2587418 RepID=A0AAN6XUM7_9PEZI|nr:hypothetical protein QBC40DRAFT_345051 [Triangularia verruculosa]
MAQGTNLFGGRNGTDAHAALPLLLSCTERQQTADGPSPSNQPVTSLASPMENQETGVWESCGANPHVIVETGQLPDSQNFQVWIPSTPIRPLRAKTSETQGPQTPLSQPPFLPPFHLCGRPDGATTTRQRQRAVHRNGDLVGTPYLPVTSWRGITPLPKNAALTRGHRRPQASTKLLGPEAIGVPSSSPRVGVLQLVGTLGPAHWQHLSTKHVSSRWHARTQVDGQSAGQAASLPSTAPASSLTDKAKLPVEIRLLVRISPTCFKGLVSNAVMLAVVEVLVPSCRVQWSPNLCWPSGIFHRFALALLTNRFFGFNLMRQACQTYPAMPLCGIRGPASGNFSIPIRQYLDSHASTIIRPNPQALSFSFPCRPVSQVTGFRDRPEGDFHRCFPIKNATKSRPGSGLILLVDGCADAHTQQRSGYPSLGFPEALARNSPRATSGLDELDFTYAAVATLKATPAQLHKTEVGGSGTPNGIFCRIPRAVLNKSKKKKRGPGCRSFSTTGTTGRTGQAGDHSLETRTAHHSTSAEPGLYGTKTRLGLPPTKTFAQYWQVPRRQVYAPHTNWNGRFFFFLRERKGAVLGLF